MFRIDGSDKLETIMKESQVEIIYEAIMPNRKPIAYGDDK